MRDRRSLRLPGFAHRRCHRYFLTYGTFARARVFVARDPVACASAQFLRAAGEQRFEILTYCFMPDHVHLLVEGVEEASDAKAFIARSKQYSGFQYKARTGGRLWQRDSFERVLRDHEGSQAASRYILANPVRAGLVARPLDYPYSGSFAWDRQALLDVFVES
jgi:putative transposase